MFHMISCLTEHGRVGLTAVGDTRAQADATYQRAEQILRGGSGRSEGDRSETAGVAQRTAPMS